MARVRVPEHAFDLALQVRSYEVGRDGSLRPANILRYFEYLATEDSADRGFDHTWYERNNSAWVVREMRLRLGALPGIGEWLRMATWVSSYGRVQAYRDYALWHEARGALIARAQARWGYVDRMSGRPTRVPAELSARILSRGIGMPPWTWLEPAADAREQETFAMAVLAREVEADSQQHINNCVYLDWIEELAARQVQSAPPPVWRRIALDYLRPALPGEAIRLTSSLSDAGRRAQVGRYEMTSGDEHTPILRARVLSLGARPAQLSLVG